MWWYKSIHDRLDYRSISFYSHPVALAEQGNSEFLLFSRCHEIQDSCKNIHCFFLKKNRKYVCKINSLKGFWTFSYNLEKLQRFLNISCRITDGQTVFLGGYFWWLTNNTATYQGIVASPDCPGSDWSKWWARLSPSCCRLCVADVLLQTAISCHFEKLKKPVCSRLTASGREEKKHTPVIKCVSSRHTLTYYFNMCLPLLACAAQLKMSTL